MLFNGRNDAIKYVDDCSSMILDAKRKATKGEGLKILSPKQTLHRLPTTLVKVNAGNTSENLLHEIRQIIYSLYQAKEITKQV